MIMHVAMDGLTRAERRRAKAIGRRLHIPFVELTPALREQIKADAPNMNDERLDRIERYLDSLDPNWRHV